MKLPLFFRFCSFLAALSVLNGVIPVSAETSQSNFAAAKSNFSPEFLEGEWRCTGSLETETTDRPVWEAANVVESRSYYGAGARIVREVQFEVYYDSAYFEQEYGEAQQAIADAVSQYAKRYGLEPYKDTHTKVGSVTTAGDTLVFDYENTRIIEGLKGTSHGQFVDVERIVVHQGGGGFTSMRVDPANGEWGENSVVCNRKVLR